MIYYLKYILIFVMILLIQFLSSCETDYISPFDPLNPETHGDPYNLRVKAKDDIVILEWDKIPGITINGMSIYRSSSLREASVKIGTSKSLEFNDEIVQPCTTYYYQVSAFNDKVEMPLSSRVTVKTNGFTMKDMVLIPAGDFQMGDNFNEGYPNERPVHTVYLDAFYIDKYEVNNAQYRKFIDVNPANKTPAYWNNKNYNAPDQPVVGISWDGASAYAKWIGKRLPTEAEWEKAARGGLLGKRFPWGDDWPPPLKAGNFADEAFKRAFPEPSVFIPGYGDGYTYPAPVGRFSPNGYGLYDMSGNVFEWCADEYDENYYEKSPKNNPKAINGSKSSVGPFNRAEPLGMVIRGGSWNSFNETELRVAFRRYSRMHTNNIGFRCVMSWSN